MAILLILYIVYIDGRQAWGGFTYKAFHNWGPMCKYALSGVVMTCSEWAAFEVLALAASYIGTAELGANSILNTSITTTYQIPFALSVAVSTRVGNLLGATLDDAARIASNVGLLASSSVGILNGYLSPSCLEVYLWVDWCCLLRGKGGHISSTMIRKLSNLLQK
jgi:multidrug resistance protein, MATE family